MKNFIASIEKAERIYLSLMVCSSILLSVVGVFYRYFLNSSLAFVEELAGFMLAGIIVIGASLAITAKEHIRVEVITQTFPATRPWLNALALLSMFGVSALMLVLTSSFVLKLFSSHQTSTSLEFLPVGVPLVIMPVGYLLCSLKSAWLLVNEVTGKGAPDATQSGAAGEPGTHGSAR